MIVLPPGKSTAEPAYRQFMEYDPEEKCYLCREYLAGPAIIRWAGPIDLYLHIECALRLVVGLAHDVAEAKKHNVYLEMRTEPKQYRTPLPRV